MKQTIIVKAITRHVDKIFVARRATKGAEYELLGGELPVGSDPKRFLSQSAKAINLPVVIQQPLAIISTTSQDNQQLLLVFSAEVVPGKEKGGEWMTLLQAQHIISNIIDQEILNCLIHDTKTDELNQTTEQKDVPYTTGAVSEREIIIHTDGGSRGNPGPSAAAFVVQNQAGQILFKEGKYLGITTNNQAEYQAVKLALDKALEIGARSINFKLDSLLIVNQMNGIYKIKNRDLWPIYESIKTTIKKFKLVTFVHVRREFNREADSLVNDVLDQQGR